MKNEIILFENQNIKLEVNMKDETVWLTLDQMSKLFERDKSVISRHIKNIFKEEELDNSTVAFFATVQKEGKRNITRDIEYYSLDVIISVGYRVKSKNGILFRKWANKILKDYLIKGYAVNNKWLEYLEKTINLIDIAKRADDNLKENEAREIIRVISNYSKASNFLYLITKKHVFIDGNKRITATLFIYFLEYYNILYKENKRIIDNNTLVALTLLIAESSPLEKDILINLVMNFLCN